MKVADLIGAKLDYWAAKAQGYELKRVDRDEVYHPSSYQIDLHQHGWLVYAKDEDDKYLVGAIVEDEVNAFSVRRYSPSTDWSLGGPIITDNNISIIKEDLYSEYRAGMSPTVKVHSFNDGDGYFDTEEEIIMKHDQFGPTPLIAAMRSFVEFKFGKEVSDEQA